MRLFQKFQHIFFNKWYTAYEFKNRSKFVCLHPKVSKKIYENIGKSFKMSEKLLPVQILNDIT